jgi:hypothetical protein
VEVYHSSDLIRWYSRYGGIRPIEDGLPDYLLRTRRGLTKSNFIWRKLTSREYQEIIKSYASRKAKLQETLRKTELALDYLRRQEEYFSRVYTIYSDAEDSKNRLTSKIYALLSESYKICFSSMIKGI